MHAPVLSWRILLKKGSLSVSNTDLPSETSDHQREGGELAAEEASMETCERCECEVIFQFRCSVLKVTDRLKAFGYILYKIKYDFF